VVEIISHGKFLKVTIKDSGVGIPYDDQSKLFKLFGFLSSTQ